MRKIIILEKQFLKDFDQVIHLCIFIETNKKDLIDLMAGLYLPPYRS